MDGTVALLRPAPSGMERLVAAVRELSLAHTLEAVMAVVREAARDLCGADGATFVLRDGEQCHYADESAISPLWKGQRFPLHSCISGWAMLNKEPAVVPDIFVDPRIPVEAYRVTFVKSLVMVPIRAEAPIGAIGSYWAQPHEATPEQVRLLQALADSASVAMENVRLVSELQQRVRDSESSVRARDEFIAIASHELRTPLTALLLHLQMLQRTNGGVSADLAVASARRMARLVETLLDVSKISLEGLVVDREPMDLAALVRELGRRFAEQAIRARSKFSVSAPLPAEGRWDSLRLEQVISNLLGNAFKYAGGTPVELSLGFDGKRARLVVADHGPDIAAEDLTRIFDAFERAAPVQHYGGFGLGLYVSRKIVEAHDGVIEVRSQLGQGTTFIVELPIQ